VCLRKEKKMGIKINKKNIKVICCDKCGSDYIERVVIGKSEYPKCKKCGEVITK